MNTYVEARDYEEAIDLRQIVAQLIAQRWWILASIVMVTSVFVAFALLSKSIYRSSVVLVPASTERDGLAGGLGSALGQIGGLASLAGISVGAAGSQTEEALGVLRSRQFTDSFIRDRNLMPVFFAGIWDKATGKWTVDKEDQPTAAKAYKYFHETIRSIIQDKKTGLITLQIDWEDPQQAAIWANELVERLNAEMRVRAIARTNASVGYLEKELLATSLVPTREAINRLIEAQIKQRMVANVTQEYAFRVVDIAMPADIDDPVRPKKFLLLLAGPVVGFILGVAGTLMAGLFSTGPLRYERVST